MCWDIPILIWELRWVFAMKSGTRLILVAVPTCAMFIQARLHDAFQIW